MSKNRNNRSNVQFQMDGILKLKKVGDYLKLRDKEIRLILRGKEKRLKTKKITTAYVVDLSDMGTHLILKDVCIKRYFFFSQQIGNYNVPINNILTIQVLNSL
ncbi:hypothetical protein SAMN02746065_11866 [Desulfocicer vacuolatum DSM 3385]|uniref:Uncharacterized protein n=1 Tax=Desulfocicer vacuolatum DSM 3385 TaxID=1121400 RepID=A0A1W2DKR9_9BACT|nr:hypothetical protein [Desulfocicer vacuolatum]SMC98027.1 hypothetical protein SAMN02746065_11866 [Desulfocicer vacuolatum DSM 3385]